ncbi:MAG: HDOD domain-containing protein [Deltaproteobacteria bacterium]|nr:HDOD domain-containing protein [Deltaproteobacteria bacterium]
MSLMEEIIAAVEAMPPFPQVVHRALKELSEPEYEVADLVEILKVDQAVTANILKLCNSAYFGLPRKVSSLKEAVVYLGATQLRQLLLSGAVNKIYDQPNEGYAVFADELWRHALATAVMGQVLRRHLKLKLDDNLVFTSALLHDVGKVVLSNFVADRYLEIEKLVEEEGCAFQEAEKRVLGFDHAEIGGRIAVKWDFPPEIVAAISFHHQPARAGKSYRLLTELVALANNLTVMVGYGTGVDGLACRGHGLLLEKLQVKERDLENLLLLFQMEMAKTCDIAGVGE